MNMNLVETSKSHFNKNEFWCFILSKFITRFVLKSSYHYFIIKVEKEHKRVN